MTADGPVVVNFDCSFRASDLTASIGVVISSGGVTVTEISEVLGPMTVPEGEYNALLRGAREVVARGYDHVLFLGDSQLVCYQVAEIYQAREPRMRVLRDTVKDVLSVVPYWRIRHVPRRENKQADGVSRRALKAYNRDRHDEAAHGSTGPTPATGLPPRVQDADVGDQPARPPLPDGG